MKINKVIPIKTGGLQVAIRKAEKIEFLDEEGDLVFSLPPEVPNSALLPIASLYKKTFDRAFSIGSETGKKSLRREIRTLLGVRGDHA